MYDLHILTLGPIPRFSRDEDVAPAMPATTLYRPGEPGRSFVRRARRLEPGGDASKET